MPRRPLPPRSRPRPDPLLFNLSLVGSGPVMELMALRRLYADGVRPDAVVFEYWPPFLREDGPYWEMDRIDPRRLYPTDDRRCAVVMNVQEGTDRYECHVNTNPVEALLYVTDHPRGSLGNNRERHKLSVGLSLACRISSRRDDRRPKQLLVELRIAEEQRCRS